MACIVHARYTDIVDKSDERCAFVLSKENLRNFQEQQEECHKVFTSWREQLWRCVFCSRFSQDRLLRDALQIVVHPIYIDENTKMIKIVKASEWTECCQTLEGYVKQTVSLNTAEDHFVIEKTGEDLIIYPKKGRIRIIIENEDEAELQILRKTKSYTSVDFKMKLKRVARWNMTVQKLSKSLAMDRSTIWRKFKQELGMTPQQYLDYLKSEKLLKSLQNQELPLKVITEMYKFSSQSHLNLFCHRIWRKTAKEIRDEYK